MKFTHKTLLFVYFFSAIVLVLSSCSVQKRTTVKNFPADTAFVFNNTIILKGNLNKDERTRLLNNLQSYWDDSLQARKIQSFIFFYKIKNPPIFDTVNISKSIKFMNSYLNSQGYFYTNFKDSFYIDTFRNQRRASVSITIDPGKRTLIDSLVYEMKDKKMQKIAQNNFQKTVINPGKTFFSNDIIAAELDRMVGVYRYRGYYLLTRDNLVAVIDTANIALLQLTTDPFEQAEKIAQAEEKKKQNPTCTVVIKQREDEDSTTEADSNYFKQYRNGNIYFYPETKYTEIPDSVLKDTAQYKMYRNFNSLHHFTMFYKKGTFTFQPMREHTFMFFDRQYSDFPFYKTINNLSQIGAWQQVDTRSVLRKDTVDFHIFMVPAIKQNVTFSLEASRNTGDFLSSNNLFGLALNATYRNKNVWHRAIQSSTTLSNGVELSFDKSLPLLQTFQSSISHTYAFPRFIAPFKIDKTNKLDAVRTLLNINASYSERSNFFRLRSFVTSWGYEWKKKNKIWQLKPLNIELYSLDTLPLLDNAFISNPFLRTAFNTGSVISQQLSFTVTYPDKKNPHISNYIRFGAEEAGGPFGLIKNLQDNIYQYVKVEGEYRRLINYQKTALALRAFAGTGYNYGNNVRFGKTLPFFKQYVAGGPNSMRAWALRQLGLGSSLLSDTASSLFRDRYGDMQLEANIEYRYPLANIGGVNIGSALFMDVGNIWNIRNDPNNPKGTFSFNRLGTDIAIAAGTGIRFDFNYFLIRLDFGLKLKDPARLENNGWLSLNNFTWRNKEFTVKDAITGQTINRNNFAVQLGIGLPF
ncbi:MAG: BamA/TamA family outer membrane protein [Chitinophagaceae bacterium]